MASKKRFLFFLVHPAKFHFHRHQINELRARGHDVEVVITTKDVLEDLVREEGWEYTNIFPEGRKVRGLHVYAGAAVSLARTIRRLLSYVRGRRFDLFVGDALTFVAPLVRTPSVYLTDNPFRQAPEQSVFLATCNLLVAPHITDLGPFNRKVVRYDGYKALAHLHPSWFKPDRSRLVGLDGRPFVLIRCVGFQATHDLQRKGIVDQVLLRLVSDLRDRYQILISTERILPPELQDMIFKGPKKDIPHYLHFADFLIADSTTMCSEAAVLGTPAIEFDDYHCEIEQMAELQNKYGLGFGIRANDPERLYRTVREIANGGTPREEFRRRRDRLVAKKIDVSSYLVWLFENYPDSARDVRRDPNVQYRFR